MQSRSFNKCWQ